MGILSTLKSYGHAAKRAVLGFPKRRKLSSRQDDLVSEYDQLTWDEIRANESEDIDYDQRKDEIRQEYFELEQQKVDTWDGRSPEERAQDRIESILEDKPADTRDSILNRLIPRYLEGDEEFGQSRPLIMDRLEHRPTSEEYQDTQQRAYMTDDDIRTELFESELREYGDQLSDDERQQLAEQAGIKKKYKEKQESDQQQRIAAPDIQRQHIEDEIAEITDHYSEDARNALKNWLIPTYANESDVFGNGRQSRVERLVNRYNEQYDGLDRLSDNRIRRTLFNRMATENTPMSETDAAELSVYAEELRQIPGMHYHADQAARPTGDNGGDNDEDTEAQTDGGQPVPYTATTTGETGRRQPYTDQQQTAGASADGAATGAVDRTVDETVDEMLDDSLDIENEFMTTSGSTYRKIADDDGFRYERDGEPIPQQAYAGASAHKLPGS